MDNLLDQQQSTVISCAICQLIYKLNIVCCCKNMNSSSSDFVSRPRWIKQVSQNPEFLDGNFFAFGCNCSLNRPQTVGAHRLLSLNNLHTVKSAMVHRDPQTPFIPFLSSTPLFPAQLPFIQTATLSVVGELGNIVIWISVMICLTTNVTERQGTAL